MDEIELFVVIQNRFENARSALQSISQEIGFDLLGSSPKQLNSYHDKAVSSLDKEVKIVIPSPHLSKLRHSPLIFRKRLSKKYTIINSKLDTSNTTINDFSNNPIYSALSRLSPDLAKSYAQIKIDLSSNERISWGGTAHEIRQIIVTLLDMLGPDDEIEAQPNFKLEKDAKRPTQKQKVIFILKKKNAGSKQQEVVEKVSKFDETIAEVVRGFYGRASDAAHRLKDKKETRNLLNYFEAFAHDLLDIE